MDITGTINGETLTGTPDADIIQALGGNDTVNAGDGNDVINGGAGADILNGEAGDDNFIQDTALNGAERFNGGADFDTITLRTLTPPSSMTTVGPLSGFVFANAGIQVQSVEHIHYDSVSGQLISAVFTYAQAIGSGISQLTGGAGIDLFQMAAVVPLGGGTFTVPNLTLFNWTGPVNAWDIGGDTIILSSGGTTQNVVLNAANLASRQTLIGSFGNDTLNGSNGQDNLNGGGGVNQVFGNGGNDQLTLINNTIANGPNPPITTFFNWAGSLYDGGAGTDMLSVGGYVPFQGTLAGIEIINLLPGSVGINPGAPGFQEEAYLAMTLANFATLPVNAIFRGVGTVAPTLQLGQSFDFSGYVIEPGANIVFEFDSDGSVSGLPGTTVTWIGTSTIDIFNFDSDNNIVATGGPGADIFVLDEGTGEVTDFTIGQDRVDVSDTGITDVGRLADFITQVGSDVVIAGSSGGESVSLTLRGVNLTSLTATDFLFNSGGYQVFETEGATDDLLFGFALNDQLSGGDGNDRLYGGGGLDKLYGDGGDDRIILDGLITAQQGNPTIIDGGTGTDTLELRTAQYNSYGAFGPTTQYLLTSATITGIERLQFASDGDAGVAAVFLLNQIGGIGQISGGAGRDTLTLLAVSGNGGTFAIPVLSLTNWQTSASLATQPGDVVSLIAAGAGDFVLNAREGLGSLQVLGGNGQIAGNDVLNGSSAGDILLTTAGTDVLNGREGDDIFIIANPVKPNGQVGTLTGIDSTYNGGAGFDVLSVGGVVEFGGLLSGIEGVYLQPAIASPLPLGAGSQAAAILVFGAGPARLDALPDSLVFSGVGTVEFDIDPGDSYDGRGYTMAEGAQVSFVVTGSSSDDTIVLGALREDVDDDGVGDTDTAVFTGLSASYGVSAIFGGGVLIGNENFRNIERFRFDDGLFEFDGTQLVSVPEATSGSVADGYIAGATVWIDLDGDGVQDPDEPFAISDAGGRFTIASTAVGALRATGGTNIDTGLANTLLLSAPDGAGVINPLTTLIENLIADGASAAEAEAAVETALGLDPDLDLTQLDLIAAAATDPAALEAQKAAATIAEVIGAVVENDGNQADALDALAGLIDDAGDVGGTVDLTATATLTTVIGAGLPGEDVTDLVEDTQAVAEAIEAAEDLDDITEVQGNLAPVALDDFAPIDEDATVTGNVIVGSDSDPDVGQVLSVTTVNGAALTGQPIRGTYGTLTIAADGSYSYAADADVVDAFAPGTHLTENFAYAISDGTGGIAAATLTFDITTTADTRTLNGGNGGNTLTGDGRDDVLLGMRGDDVLAGSGGADRLYGEQGADRLSGGDGFDLLVGGQGGDILHGDGGNDVLIGGKGGDVLTGGAGADVFDFSLLDGTDRDVISDFEVGVDSIHLGAGLSVTGTSQSGASTVLALSNGGSIVLQGVHADSLDGLFSADLPDWTAGLPLI